MTSDDAASERARPLGRGRRALVAACVLLAAASIATAVGFLLAMPSAADQRRAEQTAQQQNRAAAVRAWWRTAPPGLVFPPQLAYVDATGARQQMTRIGIAHAAACPTALAAVQLAALGPGRCVAVLRAAYTDQTQTYVTTLALTVVDEAGGSATPQAPLDGRLAASDAVAPTGTATPGDAVAPVAFPGTADATAPTGVVSYRIALPAFPYEVFASTAFCDGRTGDFEPSGTDAAADVGDLTVGLARSYAAAVDDDVAGAAG